MNCGSIGRQEDQKFKFHSEFKASLGHEILSQQPKEKNDKISSICPVFRQATTEAAEGSCKSREWASVKVQPSSIEAGTIRNSCSERSDIS